MERKWKTTNCMIQSLVSLAFDETKNFFFFLTYFFSNKEKVLFYLRK